VEPTPQAAMHAPPAMPAPATLRLSAFLCASRELCGSATATLSLAPRGATP
jgi:hypothetical protein